jgi:hypothetical protein
VPLYVTLRMRRGCSLKVCQISVKFPERFRFTRFAARCRAHSANPKRVASGVILAAGIPTNSAKNLALLFAAVVTEDMLDTQVVFFPALLTLLQPLLLVVTDDRFSWNRFGHLSTRILRPRPKRGNR